MDTTTVLEIIKMIDTRTFVSNMECDQDVIDKATREYYRGRIEALEEMANHLQSFIEGQLNALENQSSEQ